MRFLGNLDLKSGNKVTDFEIEVLNEDPSSPEVGRLWFNSSEGLVKIFNGSSVKILATKDNISTLEINGGESL